MQPLKKMPAMSLGLVVAKEIKGVWDSILNTFQPLREIPEIS
jgi:hypothetical protein